MTTEEVPGVQYVVEGRQATREEFERYQSVALLVTGNAYSRCSNLPGGLVFFALAPPRHVAGVARSAIVSDEQIADARNAYWEHLRATRRNWHTFMLDVDSLTAALRAAAVGR